VRGRRALRNKHIKHDRDRETLVLAVLMPRSDDGKRIGNWTADTIDALSDAERDELKRQQAKDHGYPNWETLATDDKLLHGFALKRRKNGRS
jgi:hypothetical protein